MGLSTGQKCVWIVTYEDNNTSTIFEVCEDEKAAEHVFGNYLYSCNINSLEGQNTYIPNQSFSHRDGNEYIYIEIIVKNTWISKDGNKHDKEN